jgi:hypothetical protein
MQKTGRKSDAPCLKKGVGLELNDSAYDFCKWSVNQGQGLVSFIQLGAPLLLSERCISALVLPEHAEEVAGYTV